MHAENVPLTSKIVVKTETTKLKETITRYFKKEISKIPLSLYKNVTELNDLDLSKMAIKVLPKKLFGPIKKFKNINFSNNQIEQIPDDLFQEATHLTEIRFTNNKIKKLPENLFIQAELINSIYFDNNQIEQIPINIFQNAIKLKTISFKGNKITNLPENLFLQAKSLKQISFCDNQIEQIPDNLFPNATKLFDIQFHNNRINKLPENLFSNCESLNKIFFNNNQIDELPDKLFPNAVKLNIISFKSNRITKLPEYLFNQAKSLNGITFEDNKIEEIKNNIFLNAIKIDAISFENNMIKNLEENLFPKAKSLEAILFSNNQIEEIPSNIFPEAKNLKLILFKNNKIKKLPENLFPQALTLNSIYFGDNQIEEIPNNIFPRAIKLEIIWFNENKISKLPENLFPKAEELEKIYFQNNQIEQIPNNLFPNATKIEWINFNQNQLKNLPDNLFSNVKSLERILFSDNQIEKISNSIFSNAIKLEWISFNNNKIKKLSENLFPQALTLNSIYFGDNQIEEIPNNIFPRAVKLEMILFKNNKIKKLPENLFPRAVTLNSIYFEKNQIEFIPNNIFPRATKLLDIRFNDNQIDEIPINLLANVTELSDLCFDNNKVKNIPYFFNINKIDGWIDFSNNDINQYDFNQLKKLKVSADTTHFDFRFNIDENDISFVFKNFFNENIKLGIKRIKSESDLFNRLFIFYFNRSSFKVNDNYFKQFENNIEKLKKDDEGNVKFSLLDFFISFDNDIDSFWIILFKNYVQNLMNQNVENIDFKFYSVESLEAIFKRNDLNLIEKFFKNEISNMPDYKASNKFINKTNKFYSNINFVKCFEIIHENDNEKMAIYLFKILKFIYEHNYNNYSCVNVFDRNKSDAANIKHMQQAFSSSIVKKMFEKNWNNLIKSILDDLNENENDYLYLKNNEIKESNNILMLINESKDETFLNHETTNQLLTEKWKSFPRFIYYFHFLQYLLFIVTYSLNIELYNQITEENNNEKIVTITKWSSFFICIYFTIFEYLQLIDSFIDAEILNYVSSFKNVFELISLPMCLATLLLPNSELKSSFYSITILLSYWILMMRLDKFHYIGKFINVFGSIITRSMPLFIIVIINLIAFVLSFRNRTNYNFISKNNQTNTSSSDENLNHQMTHFNVSFSNSIFKSFELLVGGLSTENMGMEEFNSYSFINYLIYGCFIFMMTILFINIFTGISIDEIQSLIHHSEAQIQSRKIEYVFKIESLKNRYFKKIPFLRVISMPFKKILNIIKDKLNKMRRIIIQNKYLKKCFFNKSKKNETIKQQDDSSSSNKSNKNEDLERIKNQIKELKLIMQRKFESIDRNMKIVNQNTNESLEKINKNIEIRLDKIEKK